MRVLVTGASGYLGGHVVDAAVSAGHDVIGFVHSPGAGLPAGAKCVVGDLNDRPAVEAAVRDVDGIIFSAGRNWQPGLAIDEYARQNVSIVETFFAVLAGVNPGARVVFTSSMSATAGSQDPVTFDETTGRANVAEPLLNAYDRSKIACERSAQAARAKGLDVVILNPGLMLGPGVLPQTRITTTFLIQWHCLRKNPAIVAEGGHSFCDVRDVARAHVTALARGSGQYLLGGDNLSNIDFQRVMSDQTGLGIPRRVPPAVPVVASAVMEAVSLATLGAWKNPIHRQFARSLPLYYWADSTRARQELDYKPRPLPVTIRDTIADFVKVELLPKSFGYVSAITDENRPAMLLMRELAERHLHRAELLPRLPRILSACRQNRSLDRALEAALSAGRYDSDTGRFLWTTKRPAAALATLSHLLDYCYYASDDFRARMAT